MTLELNPNSKIQVEYTLLPGNIAEIKIEGFGYIRVDGEEFVLHPITPICSARLALNMRKAPKASVALMRAVEDLASKIFPQQCEAWLWGMHDTEHLCPDCSN